MTELVPFFKQFSKFYMEIEEGEIQGSSNKPGNELIKKSAKGSAYSRERRK